MAQVYRCGLQCCKILALPRLTDDVPDREAGQRCTNMVWFSSHETIAACFCFPEVPHFKGEDLRDVKTVQTSILTYFYPFHVNNMPCDRKNYKTLEKSRCKIETTFTIKTWQLWVVDGDGVPPAAGLEGKTFWRHRQRWRWPSEQGEQYWVESRRFESGLGLNQDHLDFKIWDYWASWLFQLFCKKRCFQGVTPAPIRNILVFISDLNWRWTNKIKWELNLIN